MAKRVLIPLLLALTLSPRSAAADPLQITSGRFALDIELDIFDFAGEGFSLQSSFAIPDLIHSTKLFERGGGPLVFPPFAIETEGQVLDWGFATTPGEQLLGRGSVVDGITASDVDFVGSMRVDAVPTPLVSGGSFDFEYVAPFSFTAFIRGVRGGEELFAREFIGSGHVRVNYEGSELNPGVFGFHDDTIVYQFEAAAPVPEPGTLVLIGSGLAAVVLRRSRRGMSI